MVRLLFATMSIQVNEIQTVVCWEKQPKIQMLINSKIELPNTMHVPKV